MNLHGPFRLKPGLRTSVIWFFLVGATFNPILVPNPITGDCPAQATALPLGSVTRDATVKVAVGNLRAEPDLAALVIDKVVRGSRLRLIESKPPWHLVELADARRGWVHESLITIEEQAPAGTAWHAPEKPSVPASGRTAATRPRTTRYTVRVATARVRREPNLQADILFRLPQGSPVRVKGLQEDWFLIEDGRGRSGWAVQGLFASSDAASTEPDATPQSITAIEHQVISGQVEQILFKLNGSRPPQAFTIGGDRPRMVCDFNNARPEPGLGHRLAAGGSLVKGIRIASHPGALPKVRVVLDLAPDRNYVVEQTFYKKESLFTLIIKSDKED